MDLGGGKDSYLGLPVSHGEEEGNGGSVPWSWCRTRNQKWTRAKIESHGREKTAIEKRKSHQYSYVAVICMFCTY